ncbi:MAG: hypothetical protein LBS52_08910 [Dysgonamonadaceae bacterium]|jgi:hypothetical protein|nr:hypothetical protein [Dysgonamonadaceae bacterium]
MVRFEENKLVVEIATACPREELQLLYDGLCNLIAAATAEHECPARLWAVAGFMRDLMPNLSEEGGAA